MANSDWARHVSKAPRQRYYMIPDSLHLRITDSPFYGYGFYETDGTLIDRVCESGTGKVVAESINGVVQFDHRSETK